MRRHLVLVATVIATLARGVCTAQGLTGAIIGIVTDPSGAALHGARVQISSTSLIGGLRQLATSGDGQLRFAALPPGTYELEVELAGFTSFRESGIRIASGGTIEMRVELQLRDIAEWIVVDAGASRLDARNPGLATLYDFAALQSVPTRRSGVFDFIRAAPGISPTSPASGTQNGVSAFGSSTNENIFLIDGTNHTSPSNGAARADPGIDFIHEIRVQSVGASAEYGHVQGAVVNVVTRQGGEQFRFDASYYTQPAGLTSQPVSLPLAGSNGASSAYTRTRYRDFAAALGGPAISNRLWFFAGYQHVRDYDSQPGTDPRSPRTNQQDKIFTKLTWRLAPRWQLMQSAHQEFWVVPEQPTLLKPTRSTVQFNGQIPTVTFGHLTHTASDHTVWEARLGHSAFYQHDDPWPAGATEPSRFDRDTRIFSGAPAQIGRVTANRLTAKAAITNYRPRLLRTAHEWRVGTEIERGEHQSLRVIPFGERFVDRSGAPFQRVTSDPSVAGGVVVTVAGFISDHVTVGDRLTITAGLRFDHSRANSPNLAALDAAGREIGAAITGLGTLYTWNVWSPRIGAVIKLHQDGQTVLRASYGRYRQGIFTGELSPLHPGVAAQTTYDFDRVSGGYTILRSTIDQRNLQLDHETRGPRTDESSVGMDHQIGHQVTASLVYVRKQGANFIGWTDVGGIYQEETRVFPNGYTVPVFVLANSSPERVYRLTNVDEYSSTYQGLVLMVDKRRADGWQASGSYTLSTAYGLQSSSGTTAAGAQISTVGSPPVVFGRDPNDLTNARGRLPNDRPHLFRVMATGDVPHVGLVLAGHFQFASGKPWAGTTVVALPAPQSGQQRILLEPRGSKRLDAQTLLDVRVSKSFRFASRGRLELIFDVLNALNDTAAEGLVSDELFDGLGRPAVVQPNLFVDPRRVMLSVRLNLGR